MRYVFLSVLCLVFLPVVPTVAQVRISPTPIPVVIPTMTPPATELALVTPTPTLTPTPEGPVVALAIPNEFDQRPNVRAQPDPAAEVVGNLDFDTPYVITGRYFSWWRLSFDQAPGNVGWVFESVIEISGNEAEVPEVNPFEAPEDDESDGAGAETENDDTSTTGEDGAQEDDRRLVIPDSPVNDPAATSLDTGPLPTFTMPPNAPVLLPTAANEFVQATAAPDLLTETLNTVASGNLPPIVPVVLLGGFGLLGLVYGLIRS